MTLQGARTLWRRCRENRRGPTSPAPPGAVPRALTRARVAQQRRTWAGAARAAHPDKVADVGAGAVLLVDDLDDGPDLAAGGAAASARRGSGRGGENRRRMWHSARTPPAASSLMVGFASWAAITRIRILALTWSLLKHYGTHPVRPLSPQVRALLRFAKSFSAPRNSLAARRRHSPYEFFRFWWPLRLWRAISQQVLGRALAGQILPRALERAGHERLHRSLCSVRSAWELICNQHEGVPNHNAPRGTNSRRCTFRRVAARKSLHRCTWERTATRTTS